MDTQTLSFGDKYLRDAVSDVTWQKNVVTFPNGKVWERNQKWLTAPDPQGHEDPVRYLTYGCAFRLVDVTNKQVIVSRVDQCRLDRLSTTLTRHLMF